MLCKQEIGNRIFAIRKEAGYTQGEFAEKLGVSTQAVSKWENGQSIPDVEILLEISRQGGLSINEILEGRRIFPNIARPALKDGEITFFSPDGEMDAQWARNVIGQGWVKRNWEWAKTNTSHQQIAKRINEHGGLILEIGAGPGGGFIPAILLENQNAWVILSDISPTVVREWRKLFSREFFPPYVYYAVLDNCDLPFHDHTIDIVTAGGGFGNIEGGSKFTALNEIYRVLKPGGLYVVGDGFVTQETLQSHPAHVQRVLKEKRPDIFENYHEASVTAGFKKIDNVVTGGWDTDNDESDIADLAKELGINIHFTSYLRYCTK